MCDSCTGDPTKFQELLSPEQQALRKKLILGGGKEGSFPGISNMMDVGATPYGGPLSAGIDPMSLMAANVMMGIGTGGQRGYTAPNFYGSGGQAVNPWTPQSPWDDTRGGGGPNFPQEQLPAPWSGWTPPGGEITSPWGNRWERKRGKQ